MTKGDEMTRPGSAWSRIPLDEPVFVIRAQDQLGPATVRSWCEFARIAGVPTGKILEAEDLAEQMLDWQRDNGMKRPD